MPVALVVALAGAAGAAARYGLDLSSAATRTTFRGSRS